MTRELVAVAITVTVLLPGRPLPARAEPDPAFDVSSARGLLPGAVPLGSVSSGAVETTGYAGSGPCPGEERPKGNAHAAVYRQPGYAVRTLMELNVTDDADASLSLCEVAVYKAKAGSVSFTDPFSEAQRQALIYARTTGCSSAGTCALTRWLPAGQTFYVVFWSQPPDTPAPGSPADPSPAEARFAYDAKVRREITVSAGVRGYRIKELCRGYHEVVAGRLYDLTANTSPDSGGYVRFYLYRWDGREWDLLVTATKTTSGGSAAWRRRAASNGRYRVAVKFLGNGVKLPATSTSTKVHFISPPWTRYADGGVRLTVPFYRQQYSLSCEAAAFRMAHNYHPGHVQSDMDVYRVTGVDPRRPAVDGGCNPDRAFCGNVNGQMMVDGYGVHSGPIARAAAYFAKCRPGVKLYRYSATQLAKHVDNGYPVVVWGAQSGWSGIHAYAWRAWDGRYVTAWSVEHVWTVIGFRGTPGNPASFIIRDPAWGTRTVSRAAFDGFTRYFRTAVVVRG